MATEPTEQQRKHHIREMKEQLRRHCGQEELVWGGNFRSLAEEEKFLEQILFMEGVKEQPLFDLLEKDGVRLPQPQILNDAELHAKLWEVINAMARLGHYLSSTDHLSDRQLYERLWTDTLRVPTSVCPDGPSVSCHIDLLGGCSEEDLQLRLKYYMDEEERLHWANEFAEDVIPEHEPLPYDRDRLLPAPPGWEALSLKADC